MKVIMTKDDLKNYMHKYYAHKRMKITLPQCIFQSNKKSFDNKGECDEFQKSKKD